MQVADKFEELRTWITIVETGGVNAAAARLGIARSAASRRLSDLEARLGVTLLERTTRRFDLTDTGRRFYDESRRIIADMEALERSLLGEVTGGHRLIVATDRDLAADLLPELVAGYLSANPDVRLTFRIEAEATSDADVVVAPRQLTGGRTIARYQRLVVAAPALLEASGTPASPAELSGKPGIVVTAAEGEWTFAAGATTPPDVVLEVADVAGARAAAIAGIGLAHLPSFSISRAIAAKELRSVMDAHSAPADVVQVAAGERRSAAADRLMDHLASNLSGS